MTHEEYRQVLSALATHTDPATGELISSANAYSVLFNEQVEAALNYALGVLDFSQTVTSPEHPAKKGAFVLTDDERNRIQSLPGVPLNVSQIASMINSVIPDNRRKMQSSKINQWLTKRGILEDDVFDGKTHHKLTDYGKQMGAHGMKVPSRYGGEYWNNVFPVRIQADIINHAEEIMNS